MKLGGRSATDFKGENMANEVKKLIKMGIETPQTRYLIMKEKNAFKDGDVYFVVDHSEPMKRPLVLNQLRVDETGQIVHPPVKPEEPKPIDQSNWVRITPKRREKLAQYRRDMESYEHEMVFYEMKMNKWLKLPLLDEGRTREEHIHGLIMALRNKPVFHGVSFRTYFDYLNGVFDPQPAVLVYWARGFGEVRICSRPVTHTELEIIECDVNNNYWAQMGFEGNASQERRHYKRNRSIPKEEWADTNLNTGEPLQQTLFTCKTSDARKVPDLNVLESFIEKPNSYLAKAYLEYILNGTELTDWQRFQLMRRNTVKRTWSIH